MSRPKLAAVAVVASALTLVAALLVPRDAAASSSASPPASAIASPARGASAPTFGVRAQPGASTLLASEADPSTSTALSLGWQARAGDESPAWLAGEVSVSGAGFVVDILGLKVALLDGRLSPFVEVAVSAGQVDDTTRATAAAGAGLDVTFGRLFVEASGKGRLYRDAPTGVPSASGVTQLVGGIGAGWLF